MQKHLYSTFLKKKTSLFWLNTQSFKIIKVYMYIWDQFCFCLSFRQDSPFTTQRARRYSAGHGYSGDKNFYSAIHFFRLWYFASVAKNQKQQVITASFSKPNSLFSNKLICRNIIMAQIIKAITIVKLSANEQFSSFENPSYL